MKSFEVVAAIIYHQEKILCVQRGEGKHQYISYKYEFPGGKVENEETLENAIIREIREELNLEITVKEAFLMVEHHYPDLSLNLHSFICHCDYPEIVLNEHIDHKWLSPNELDLLEWAAADLPIVEKLKGITSH